MLGGSIAAVITCKNKVQVGVDESSMCRRLSRLVVLHCVLGGKDRRTTQHAIESYGLSGRVDKVSSPAHGAARGAILIGDLSVVDWVACGTVVPEADEFCSSVLFFQLLQDLPDSRHSKYCLSAARCL